MTVYVTTCDKYSHLLKGFAYLFNKYWGAEQAVVVLGFAKPDFELPPNFKFHSMEEKETRPWTDNLKTYFESIDGYAVVGNVDVNRNLGHISIATDGTDADTAAIRRYLYLTFSDWDWDHDKTFQTTFSVIFFIPGNKKRVRYKSDSKKGFFCNLVTDFHG